jgi:hypothetical protein
VPRYFFNFLDGRNVRDGVGSEHPDIASVREEAVGVLTEILKGRLLVDEDMATVMVQVTNEQNETVLIVSLLAAVRNIQNLSSPAVAP